MRYRRTHLFDQLEKLANLCRRKTEVAKRAKSPK